MTEGPGSGLQVEFEKDPKSGGWNWLVWQILVPLYIFGSEKLSEGKNQILNMKLGGLIG